jgi:hypothetical protein
MDERKALKRFGRRVGYTEAEMEGFQEGDPRLRQMDRLARAAPKYSIVAEVVQAKNCNSGYAVAQFTVPVALINERLSEGLDPNEFHFMKFVHCPDTWVECAGYGQVRFEMKVVPRIKVPPA